MAALANLLLLGKEGFRTLIGHAVEMAEVLREEIISRPDGSIFAIAALTCLAVAAVHALFDFNFYMPANAATLAAICGAGVGLRSTEEAQTRARGADVRRA